MIAERDFERVNNRPKKNKTTDAEIAEYEKRKSITQLDPTDNRGLPTSLTVDQEKLQQDIKTMAHIDKQTGLKISDAYCEKLNKVKAVLETGAVIDKSEFIAAGIRESVVPDAIVKLKSSFDLDILTITRSNRFVGYILAGEIL